MADITQSESVDEHLEQILTAIHPLGAQHRPLDGALGLILAEEVTALTDVPGFDNSAMDGYAVRRVDLTGASPAEPVTLPVIAELAAGSSAQVRLGPATATLIMTGAPLPDGADAVVPLELTDRGTDRVAFFAAPSPAAHIRRAGDDVRAGQPVLTAGRILTARQVSAAAAAGRNQVLVHPAPKVGVISTGSELVPAGDCLGRGQIHDSNSHLLAAAVREAGGIPLRAGPVADDEAALLRLLTEYAPQVDAFVLSGGASVGAHDVVKSLLAPLGIRFGPVRMQPGKPQGFGLWEDGTPVFCLPGNPVSAFVSFEVFVRPALLKLRGHGQVLRPSVPATVASGWSSPAGRRQYMPVSVQQDARPGITADGAPSPRIRPATAGGSGSHLVTALALADALAVIPEETVQVQAGDRVPIIPLGADCGWLG
ncbi:MAG: molybdopterin molybdotransferase MoeA [Microbacteriaceae bacterium]